MVSSCESKNRDTHQCNMHHAFGHCNHHLLHKPRRPRQPPFSLNSLPLPIAKKPKVWGVPLVPLLPSASVGINIFLLGSLDLDSFKRFGFWTAILIFYYLLVGLHASYDIAKLRDNNNDNKNKKENQLNLDEENVENCVSAWTQTSENE